MAERTTRRIGPLVVAGQTVMLVVDDVDDVADRLEAGMADLRPDAAMAGTGGDPVIIEVIRARPTWLDWPWEIRRGGVTSKTSFGADSVVAAVGIEFEALTVDVPPPAVGVHASVVGRDGVAVALAGAIVADADAFVTAAGDLGWGFVGGQVAVFTPGEHGVWVPPNWIPTAVATETGEADVTAVSAHRELVPGGWLARTVVVQPRDAAPVPRIRMVGALVGGLDGPGPAGRRRFERVGAMMEPLPMAVWSGDPDDVAAVLDGVGVAP